MKKVQKNLAVVLLVANGLGMSGTAFAETVTKPEDYTITGEGLIGDDKIPHEVINIDIPSEFYWTITEETHRLVESGEYFIKNNSRDKNIDVSLIEYTQTEGVDTENIVNLQLTGDLASSKIETENHISDNGLIGFTGNAKYRESLQAGKEWSFEFGGGLKHEQNLPPKKIEAKYDMSLNFAVSETTVVTDPDKFATVAVEGGVQITGFITGEGDDVNNLVFPSEINNKPIVSIRTSAFEYNSNIEYVRLPEKLHTIGDFAFNKCENLTEIDFSKEIQLIGVGAFKECTSLKAVKLPDKLVTIMEFAFYNCNSLTSVLIPDSVTEFNIQIFGKTSPDLIIYCNIGSEAERYAQTHIPPFPTDRIDQFLRPG